jgi:hypothetical protein
LTAMVLAAAAGAWAGEVSVKSVPKPVHDTVKARFKDASVAGASKEQTPEGKLVYEVNLKQHGRNIDVTLAPDGSMQLIEQEIARKELPRAVADTLEKRYPKARYRMIEQVITVEAGKETLSHYEALLDDSRKKVWSVELGLDGAVRKIEDKTANPEAD